MGCKSTKYIWDLQAENEIAKNNTKRVKSFQYQDLNSGLKSVVC